MKSPSSLAAAFALLVLAPVALADELSPEQASWGQALSASLGETVDIELESVELPAGDEAASPGAALSLRVIGKAVQVERAWYPRPDLTRRRAMALVPPDQGTSSARVGEARGAQVVTITGQLGDAGWARRLLDVAWTVLPAPAGPTTMTFVVRGKDELAVLCGGPEGSLARSITEGLTRLREVAALPRARDSEDLLQLGEDEYQLTTTACVSRSGMEPATGRVWLFRGPGLAGEARLETYLACLGVRLPTRG